ncbi:MAG: cobalamin B12-binding domain-containing protein [Verrucomicrobia bacterium]|nr:cobalamin B12-binding domain-containing protein [Verrucomicrobiota bacterium]
MKPLDLLVLNPNGRKRIYQELSVSFAAIEPPTWGLLIATSIRKRGYSVRVLDADAENLDAAEAAERVVEAKPRLVAVVVHGQQPSASTQNMPAAREACAAIRNRAPEIKLLMAGTHPSALPERTLREEPIDFVCQGEGPITLLGLLQSSLDDRANYSNIAGLWFREGDAIRPTAPASLIENLDEEFGGLAWDLLPMDQYRAHNWHCFDRIHERQPYASLYTSFSCPFKCSFCCIASPYGGPGEGYRRFSPAQIIREIDVLVNQYHVRNIKIIDEMFVLNEKHVVGICDLIIQRGYDLNIWAYARVDTIRDNMLGKLKKAGFNWLGVGIESASKYVRDGVDKTFGARDIRKIVEKVRSAGIHVGANFIFGLPDDDLQTMQATLDLAIDLCPDWANFYSAMAYPGSRLFAMALEKKWALPDSWIGYSQHAYETLPLPTDKVPAAEVLRFRDQAFHIFFTHPRYLDHVARQFGKDALEHVRQMTTHRLKRKHAPESFAIA